MVFIDLPLLLNIILPIHFIPVIDVLVYSNVAISRKVAAKPHASLYVMMQLELRDINILMKRKYQEKASTASRPQ